MTTGLPRSCPPYCLISLPWENLSKNEFGRLWFYFTHKRLLLHYCVLFIKLYKSEVFNCVFTAPFPQSFCGASLTSAGAASLASALEKCLHITDVKCVLCLCWAKVVGLPFLKSDAVFFSSQSVSDNSLRDDGIRVIADVFDKLPGLMSVKWGVCVNPAGLAVLSDSLSLNSKPLGVNFMSNFRSFHKIWTWVWSYLWLWCDLWSLWVFFCQVESEQQLLENAELPHWENVLVLERPGYSRRVRSHTYTDDDGYQTCFCCCCRQANVEPLPQMSNKAAGSIPARPTLFRPPL